MEFPRLAATTVPAIPLNTHSLNQVQGMHICRCLCRFSLIHLQGELSLRNQIGQNTLHDVTSSCRSLAVFCPHSSLFRDGLRTYISRCTIADDVYAYTNDSNNRRLFLLLPKVRLWNHLKEQREKKAIF